MRLTLTDVALTDLVDHARNIRRDVGDVDELAASIASVGLLEPLIVAPTSMPGARRGAGPNFRIIAGHRRAAAARQAGLESVPAIVRADLDTDAAQIEAMLVENLHRADLSPIEEACGYQQLVAFYMDVEEIASKVGRSATTVRGRLALTKLADREQEKIHAGQMTLTDAECLLDFLADEKTYEVLANAAGGRDFAWRLQQAQDARKRVKATALTLEKFSRDKVKRATKSQIDNAYSIGLGELVDAKTGTKLTGKNHAACPGHRGYPNPHTGAAAYLCADPKKHGHVSSYEYGRHPSTTAAETADAVERQRINEALAQAGHARRAFITTLVRLPKLPADALDAVLLWTCNNAYLNMVDVTDVLGLTSPDNDDVDGDAAWAMLSLATDQVKLSALLAGALLQRERNCEVGSYRRWDNVWAGGNLRRHVQWLVDHGYQLSPIEEEVLAATAPETPAESVPA